jgi:TusA-related sulfurtransferase
MSYPTLDVRDDLRAGREPLPKILTFVDQLPGDAAWRLLVPFEPIPLLRLMEGRGYRGEARQVAKGDWEVIFTPADRRAKPRTPSAQPADEPPGPPTIRLDNRGLLPPEPMIRVLEALEALPPDGVLEVWNDREPAFLYPELAARGWHQKTERTGEGVRILIWRSGA